MGQYPFQQTTGVTYPFQQPAQQQGFIPMFPQVPSGGVVQTPGVGGTGPQIPGMLPLEQSYIENIFRLNKGKLTTVYMSFEGSNEWNSKVFKGIVEAAGRDHLILSDPQTGYRYLLPMVFFNYAVFEEELEYDYPFGGMTQQQMTTYSPR
nr:spore coat protein GerQ [Bacillus kwashiorkori]